MRTRLRILTKGVFRGFSRREPRLGDPSSSPADPTPASRMSGGQQLPQVGGGYYETFKVFVEAWALPFKGI
jgi:hypothetical protein